MKRKLKRHKRQGVKPLIDDEIKARDKRSNQLLEKLAIDNEVRIIFDYFVIVSIDRIS